MPANLSIRNVPDDVVRGLHNRAARNNRTLQQELLAILREAARGQEDVSLDALLANAQRAKPTLDERTSRVLEAQDAEKENAAKKFADLLGGTGDKEK
jgi:plasmid stability protein